jgi:predicted dehydrogenase
MKLSTGNAVSTSPLNRRRFLHHTAAGAAALGAGAWIAPSAESANARLNLGLIGAGGRGSDLMGQILGLAEKCNVQFSAVCDVWQKNRAAAAAKIKAKQGTEPRQAARFGDLLALKEIDAVVIATPDFSHGPILTAALKAGKDVYVEKPMTIDLASANEALDLARANQRVVQAGTQRRSDGLHRGAAKLVASGLLGQINRVTASVNFNEARWARAYSDCVPADVDWEGYLLQLPQRPFDAKLLRRWQLYRDCTNGLSGLWMSHYTDAVCILTGAKYPASAVAHGNVYVWKDGREHTDTFHALLDYPEGFLFSWGMGLGNSAGTRFTMHGTKGTLDVEKWTVSPEGGVKSDVKPGPVAPEPVVDHMENWLTCLRTRARPNADIQFGHQHAVATILAATALQTGRRQQYDPARRTIVAG